MAQIIKEQEEKVCLPLINSSEDVQNEDFFCLLFEKETKEGEVRRVYHLTSCEERLYRCSREPEVRKGEMVGTEVCNQLQRKKIKMQTRFFFFFHSNFNVSCPH